MFESFLIAFRESFQCSLLLALVILYPPVRDVPRYRWSAVLGVLAACITGLALGAVPVIAGTLPGNETWTFGRHVAEAAVFYASVAALIRKRPTPPSAVVVALFALGFPLFFFDSRSLAFIVHDLGSLGGRVLASFGAGFAGLVLGFLPLVLFRNTLARLPFDRIFTPASLLMVIGALQIGFGGAGERDGESIMVPLQKGLLLFISEAMKSAQTALLITEHPFLPVDLAGLARFLASDRIALSLTVLFLMVPPVFILISLFARADPRVSGMTLGAHRRRNIASFRRDISYRTMPVLAVFLVMVVQVHTVTASLNPLYNPEPIPVREDEGSAAIRIPVSGPMGDLGDRKLRKFVYFRGTVKVLFILILKEDGSVGVALDQCEVCRPADWNKDAQGYAQRGADLICKYCMTPIATNTVNTPGGCNPIPVPFRVTSDAVMISLEDLIESYSRAQELDKKGSHL